MRASSLPLLLRAGGVPLGAWRGAVGAITARRYVAPALLSALGEYGARHGHVRVPHGFVVPDGDGWAAGARRLRLGAQVTVLRQSYGDQVGGLALPTTAAGEGRSQYRVSDRN